MSENSLKVIMSSLCTGILLLTACRRHHKIVIQRFADGKPFVIHEYFDNGDESNYINYEYYENGRIHRIDTIHGDQVVGTPIEYYPSGVVHRKDTLFHPRNIKSTQWDGIMTNYFEDGKISGQFEVRSGKIKGFSRHYDRSGNLLKTYYLDDTIKNGEYREYHPNGKIYVKTAYKHDTLTGFVFLFDENGDSLKYYNTYKGELSMPYKRWLSNGNILYGAFADSSTKTIIWRWYTKEGKETKKMIQHSTNHKFVVPERN